MSFKKGFIDWAFKNRRGAVIILALAVGILLLTLPSVKGSLSNGAEGATEEKDIEALCAQIDGVGECSLLLSYGEDGRTVVAALVICDGGDSLEIRHRLTELLSSFYGIGYNRISIQKRR